MRVAEQRPHVRESLLSSLLIRERVAWRSAWRARGVRVLPLLALSLVLLSCRDQVGPSNSPSVPSLPFAAVGDADHGTERPNPHARWLEPIVKDVMTENFGTFDPTITSARLHVVCLESNDPGVVDGGHGCFTDAAHWSSLANAIDVYQVPDGSLLIQSGQYHAQVELANLSISDPNSGLYTIYRLVATVTPGTGFSEVVVAFADFRALPNGRAKSSLNPDEIGLVGTKLPAKIRLDEGVVAHAIEDAIEDAIGGGGSVVPDQLQSFGTGEISVTVVEPGEETTATFEEEQNGQTVVTAAFQFDGNETNNETIAFVIGEVEGEGGADECGDAFGFEKAGCKRALAVSLSGQLPPSDVTSGYVFSDSVEFCILTGIPQERQGEPWQLVKIDDYGSGPEFEILERTNPAGACGLLVPPSQASASLLRQPFAWLKQNVGRRVLDFAAPPLYAEHPVDRMGSKLEDLSDIAAALLPEATFTQAPSGDVDAGTPTPVTVNVMYEGTPDGQHASEPASDLPVSFVVTGGSLADAAGTPIAGPVVTDANGDATVYWTPELGAQSLTATVGTAENPPTVQTAVTGYGVIEVNAVDGNGAALPGASVELAGPISQTAPTDANGDTRFTHLDGGDYTVTITKHPTQTTPGYDGVVENVTIPQSGIVPPVSATLPLCPALPGGPPVSVITAQPPEDAIGAVSTAPVRCATVVEFVNNSSETVEVYWLAYADWPAGPRVLTATLAPGQSHFEQTWPEHPWIVVGQDRGDLAYFEPLPVQQAPAQAIVGNGGVAVSGTVFYSTTALPAVQMELLSNDFQQVLQTTETRADGTYVFHDVLPGPYHVRAFGLDASYIGWIASSVSVQDQNLTQDIDLPKNIVLTSPADGSTVAPPPTLQWPVIPEAARYEVQINVTNGFALVEHVTNIPTNSYTPATPLQAGETYTWQVGAYDAAGHYVGATEQAFTFTVGALVDPVLSFDWASLGQPGFVRYDLTVTNWADYDDSFFEARGDLGPCGGNSTPSRTWVTIYDASTDATLKTFCALEAAANLQAIWFARTVGTEPPAAVYVRLNDRLTGQVVQSNTVPLTTDVGFDTDPNGGQVAAGTQVNTLYQSQGVTFSKICPAGTCADPGVYSNSHGPDGNGSFTFNSGQNNVSVFGDPIAADFSENVHGTIRASFLPAAGVVCIDVWPTSGQGFLQAVLPGGGLGPRVLSTSAVGFPDTLCVQADAIIGVLFSGDGGGHAIFDNLRWVEGLPSS